MQPNVKCEDSRENFTLITKKNLSLKRFFKTKIYRYFLNSRKDSFCRRFNTKKNR